MNIVMKKTFIAAAATGLLAVGASAFSHDAQAADGQEKCYGVVKTGANDCGSKTGGHSCAGQSKEDAAKHEFIILPAGICERLASGSVTSSDAAAK